MDSPFIKQAKKFGANTFTFHPLVFTHFDSKKMLRYFFRLSDIFLKLFPRIKNIHLSSFCGKEEHLPLDTGDFDIKHFLKFLAKHNYKGLLTFEINYPLTKRLFTPYDFSEIKRSVDIIKSLTQ